MIGVQAIRGRVLLPEDDEPQTPPVVVISHEIWTNRFAGREDVLGHCLEFPRGRDTSRWFTIVGVLPRDFEPPMGSIGLPNAWTALRAGVLDRRTRGYTAQGKVRQGVIDGRCA